MALLLFLGVAQAAKLLQFLSVCLRVAERSVNQCQLVVRNLVFGVYLNGPPKVFERLCRPIQFNQHACQADLPFLKIGLVSHSDGE